MCCRPVNAACVYVPDLPKYVWECLLHFLLWVGSLRHAAVQMQLYSFSMSCAYKPSNFSGVDKLQDRSQATLELSHSLPYNASECLSRFNLLRLQIAASLASHHWRVVVGSTLEQVELSKSYTSVCKTQAAAVQWFSWSCSAAAVLSKHDITPLARTGNLPSQ